MIILWLAWLRLSYSSAGKSGTKQWRQLPYRGGELLHEQVVHSYSNVLKNIGIKYYNEYYRIMLERRKLEAIVRGFSNHRRIQIMGLLADKPRLSVLGVAAELNVNFKTIAEHLRRLTAAGLVAKRNRGSAVEHALTDRGATILKFLKDFK
jgi:predicted transcriptional regulator